ncbi:MAG: conjugative transposon protein TraM [Calditrichaeota bacterium]|nr:MAG: conjugative transposon protein TraM [Calditrichota bacterium]
MIIINHLNQNTSAGAPATYTGLQSVRLKVILPQRTPVTNGSLVEVRVIKDARFGNIDIPLRSKILGIARLFNNRVQIEFNELQVKNRTYTCSGRAYDLKFLPGIKYNPLNARAKQVLLEELKSAAAGVPIVGRMVNQPDFNPLTDEITTLDEGLEFYALITNIF